MQKHDSDDGTANAVQACLQRGDLGGARRRLRDICETDESDIDNWLSLASVNARLGDFPEVERCCRHVIDIQPDNTSANYNLGLALQMQGDSTNAIKYLEQVIELNPGITEAQYYLGLAYGTEGDLDKADSSFRYVLCLQPNNAGAHCELGMVYARKEDYEQAVTCFRQAVEIDPGFLEARYNLGNALFALERFNKAAECFFQVLQSDPVHVESCRNLARILEKVGELDQAIGYYRHLVSLVPDDTRARCGLGRVYLGSHQLSDAEAEFKQVIGCDPDNYEGYLGLGQVYSERGDSEKAAGCFEEALRCNPESRLASHFLAGQKKQGVVNIAQREYVEELFDGYAERFDKDLVENLEYKTPRLLYELVEDTLGQPESKLDILDIGCGTGLSGMMFRERARTLSGIDLSSKMIEKAKERTIYDRLVVGELGAEMGAIGEEFDLVLAADVFVYIGDLQGVFSTCASILRPGGSFAFSTEAVSGKDYVLRSSGRYAHSEDYIRRVAGSQQFEIDAVRNCTLRLEMNKPVEGKLYLFHRT